MGSDSDRTVVRYTLAEMLRRREDEQTKQSEQQAEYTKQARNLMNQLFSAIQTVVDETRHPDLVVSHPWVQGRFQLSYKDTTATIQFSPESGSIDVKKTKADKAVPLDVQLIVNKYRVEQDQVVLGLCTKVGRIETALSPLDAQCDELHLFLFMCLD